MQPFTHHYSGDISREQFELIRSDLEGARKCTKAFSIDLYDVFCTILYTLKNGCTWRDLLSDFPKWQTVYYYLLAWKEPTGPDELITFDRSLNKLSHDVD